MNNIKLTFGVKQNGQAMTEFVVVAAFVLIPMLLLVPILGKHIDIKHKSIQAARYEAWEYTAWNKGNSNRTRADRFPASRFLGYGSNPIPEKNYTELKIEANKRFYSAPGSVIKRDDLTKTSFTVNPLWEDHRGTPLLDGFDTGKIVLEQNTPDATGIVTGFVGAVGDISRFLSGLLATVSIQAGFTQIDMKGKFVGRSKATMQGLRWAADSYENEQNFEHQAAVMSSAWSAGGKKHTEYQVRGLVASSLLDIEAINPIRDVLAVVLISPELQSEWLKFGFVQADAVPADRLFRGSRQGKSRCDQLAAYSYARRGKPDSDNLGIFTQNTAREIRTDRQLTGRRVKKFNSCASVLP